MKGFTLTLSLMSFIIMIVVGVTISIIIAGLNLFHIHITKTLIINSIYAPVSTQDALLSLMEFENNKIKFKQALAYSVYENRLTPKVSFNGETYVYDLSLISKNYLDYVYSEGEYWLFLYNSSTHDYKTLASSKENPEEIFEKSENNKRASFPIREDYWLVLYTK
ncbi:MAG: hypothetical protein QXQ40_00560 [Candidatus Aenigmatarchaeota archaeon]